MTGTQKMIVAIVAILALAAAAVGIAIALGDSKNTSVPVSSGTAASPPSQATPIATPGQPEKLRQPWAVRASVLSGTLVRLEWKAEGKGVRYFQIRDDGQPIGGHVSAGKRWAEFDTSYGSHCFRVVAIAEGGSRDSPASACGSVTVSKPLAPEPLAPSMSEKSACEAGGGMWDPTVGGCLGD